MEERFDTFMLSAPPPAPPQGSRPSGRPSTRRTLKNHNSPPKEKTPSREKTPPEPLTNPIMPPEPQKKQFTRKNIKAYSAAPQEPGKVLLNDEHDTVVYDKTCGCYKGKFIDGKQVVIKILKVADKYNAMDDELQAVFRNIYQISSHASYSYYYDYQLLNTVNKFKENDFDIDKYEEEYIRDIKNQIYKEPEDRVFNPTFLHAMSGDSTKDEVDSVVKRIIEAQTAGPPPQPEPAKEDKSQSFRRQGIVSAQLEPQKLETPPKLKSKFIPVKDSESGEYQKDTAEPVMFKTPDPKDSYKYYRGKISKSSGVDRVDPVIFDNETLANKYNDMNIQSQTLYRELISQIRRNGSSLKNDVLAEKVMKTVEIFEIFQYNIEYYAKLYGELTYEETQNLISPHDMVAFAPSQDRAYGELQSLMQIQRNMKEPTQNTRESYSELKAKVFEKNPDLEFKIKPSFLPAINGATKGGKKTKKRGQNKRCTQKRRKQKKC